MPMTVREMVEYLSGCDPEDHIVIAATLGDGSVIRVQEICVGTDQGGKVGEGIEVVIDWDPGAETVFRP